MSCKCSVKFEDSRAELYQGIFKDDLVPIISPNAIMGRATDTGMRGAFYKIDLTRVSNPQKIEIARRVAPLFQSDTQSVLHNFDDPKHGIPLRAAGLMVYRCEVHKQGLHCAKCGAERYLETSELEKPIFCTRCGAFISAPIRWFI